MLPSFPEVLEQASLWLILLVEFATIALLPHLAQHSKETPEKWLQARYECEIQTAQPYRVELKSQASAPCRGLISEGFLTCLAELEMKEAEGIPSEAIASTVTKHTRSTPSSNTSAFTHVGFQEPVEGVINVVYLENLSCALQNNRVLFGIW